MVGIMSQFWSLYVMTVSLIHFIKGKANSIHLITASSCNYPVPLFIDGTAWRQWIGQQAYQVYRDL